MTTETLERAKIISVKISELEDSRHRWEQLVSFRKVIDANLSNHSVWMELPTEHIPVEVLKTLTLSAINKEIIDLQNEFNNL